MKTIKSDDIFDGVTDIRDNLIEDAKNGAQNAPKRQKQKLKTRWLGLAAALALIIIGSVFLYTGFPGGENTPGGGADAHAVALARYPEMTPYPDSDGHDASDEAFALWSAWRKDVVAQRRDLGDTSDLQAFFARSAQAFLTETDGQNRIYSPLNAYMALSILARITDGESREQILDLLGGGDMDSLRQRAGDVWNASYRDDGLVSSVLANSLWLNSDIKFNQEMMDTLARDFYASSYQGKMGSNRFNKTLQNWLNEQAGGLLEEQAGNIATKRDTVLALASTVYFKAKWGNQFLKEKTEPRTFHTPSGDMETDFMHEREMYYYYWGDKFAAVPKAFRQGTGQMWFVLPDEGVTPEELIADGEILDFLFTARKYPPEENAWERQEFLYVNESIPKFDAASQIDLREGLQGMGITSVFDPELADFSPMITDTDTAVPAALSQADHAARVVMDEEGCTAAAFAAVTMTSGSWRPKDEVDFILDRPFIFCIDGPCGLPLFMGIVNYPG